MTELVAKISIPPRLHPSDPDAERAVSVAETEEHDGDAELMTRVAEGNVDAMDELLERFGPRIHRLVGRLTAWNRDYDDILQEVWLGVWQRARSYRGQGSLEGWLVRTAVNTCRNQQRAARSFARALRRFAALSGPDELGEPLVQTSLVSEEMEPVRNALRQLKEKDRSVLVLFYLEEFTGQEVAKALGIRTSALHVRLHRARQRLQALLSDHDETR